MAPKVILSRSTVEGVSLPADLEAGTVNLFRFGKLIGLISRYRIIPLSIFGLLFVNVCVPLVGFFVAGSRNTPSDLALAYSPIFFYLKGSFVYAYMLRTREELGYVFKAWRGIIRTPDPGFRKYSNITLLCIFTSAILENAAGHFQLFSTSEPLERYDCSSISTLWNRTNSLCGNETLSAFESFYHRSHPSWSIFLQFSPIIGVVLFLSNKLAFYAWNWADVLIIVFCRGISYQFAQLKKGQVGEYLILSELLRVCQSFLAPLVLSSYAMNTYALCIQIHHGLTPSKNNNFVESLYSVWSAVHLVARMLLVSLSAARIHEKSKEFLIHTPSSEGIPLRPVALSALGFFDVTRNYILHLFNVVFSVEIVLLQGRPS